MKRQVQAIILAAGKSSRFNTGITKLSFTLCGQEMILYPAKLLTTLNIPMTFVVGFQKEVIQQIILSNHIPNVTFIEQKELKGTGDALKASQATWHGERLLVLNGDVPLITQEIIEELLHAHETTNAKISFITAYSTDSSAQGLGKVIKTAQGIEIVEMKNITEEHRAQHIIEHLPLNAGIYLFERSFLEEYLSHLTPNSVTQEIYITDLIKCASDHKQTVTVVSAPFDNVRGINTMKELWAAEHIKRSELLTHWMNKGVRFAAALNVCLDLNIEIGAGTFIGTGAVLLNGTRIGKNCIINAFSFISNTIIHDNVDIKPHSAICNSEIYAGSAVGPFAHLNNSVIKDNVIIGNFVEVKRSIIGDHTKAKHLAYLGDAIVGNNVNIGAGTITCNYDGMNKHRTVIHDHAMIGGNNSLVAPVSIGSYAITGAGSTITHDVPEQALAIARARQENKEGYAPRLIKKDPDLCCGCNGHKPVECV